MLFGECDCCAKLRVLHNVTAFGVETCACAECCGGELTDDIDDYIDLAARYIKDWLHKSELARSALPSPFAGSEKRERGEEGVKGPKR